MTQPCTTRRETAGTCLKDCDSTIGVWNDPPRVAPLSAQAQATASLTALGVGTIHLLADSSIAALLPQLQSLAAAKVGCLYDSRDDADRLFHSEHLLPRSLFGHNILCQRIYPSDQYGYVDENNLFCWPVALSQFDTIVWVKSEGEPAACMRRQCQLAPLQNFVGGGGRLLLGGEARAFLPYLLGNTEISMAWPGVQHLALFGDPALAAKISDTCCQITRRDEQGMVVPAQYWAMRHEPHGYAVEAQYADNIALQVTVCFAGHDEVAIEWQLQNDAPSARDIELRVAGDFTVPGAPAVRCSADEPSLRCDLTQRLDLPARLTIDSRASSAAGWQCAGEGYRQDLTVELAPNGSVRGTCVLSLQFAESDKNGLAGADVLSPAARHWQLAQDRWQRHFASFAPLAGDSAPGSQLLQRAAATIAGNTWRPPAALAHGNYGGRRVLQVQRQYYPGWYPYEAGFYAAGVRNFDAVLARNLIELFVPVQSADGWVPLGIFHRSTEAFQGLSQIPTLAYGAWQTYRAEPRRNFLHTVYPALCANIEWWYANRQPHSRGVFGFAHGQEGGGDDHPRSDEPGGGLRGGIKAYLAPDASGFVLMEMQCLARIAETLQLGDDARLWRSRCATLGARLLETCYDSDANFFADYNIESGALRRCLNPWNLAPLWAGVALDAELAKSMVREHLIGSLMGKVPFPIVARDEPAYLRDVYWRGPSWPQLWLMCLQILWWYGFHAEADAAADRLITLCSDSPYLMEMYDSQRGEGLSLPEYSFVAAILFEIVPRRYRNAPPWRAEEAGIGR